MATGDVNYNYFNLAISGGGFIAGSTGSGPYLPLAGGTMTGPLGITGGTVTASAPLLDLSQTWNNGAVPFSGIKLNATDTASLSTSALIDLQVGSSTKFWVSKGGSITGIGNLFIQGGSITLGSSADVVITRDGAGVISMRNGVNAQTFNTYGTYTDASNYRRLRQTMTTGGAVTIAAEGLGAGATGNTLDLAAGGVSGLRINSAGGIEGPLGTITRTHAGDAGCILPSATSGSRVDATLVRHTIGTGDFSISARIELPLTNPSSTQYIGDLKKDSSNRCLIYWTINGSIEVKVFNGGANTLLTSLTTPAAIYNGQVVHYVLTRSGTTMSAYLNGQLIGSQTDANAGANFDSNTIFSLPGSNGLDPFKSRIYNARLYRRALSASDVVNLMNKGIEPSDEWDNPTALTSGTLVIGKRYRITTFVSGDSFTNVGAASNATGVEFVATGTTPTTWTNSSTLDRIGCMLNWDLGVGTGLAIPDLSSNCYTGAGTGISHPVPKRFGEVVIRRQLLASEISTSVATTKLFDLPQNCGIADIEIDRASAMDSGITLNIGKSGTAARYASAMAADATGLLGTDSLFKFSESSTVDTAIYVQKSGATTVGSVTIKVRFIIRG